MFTDIAGFTAMMGDNEAQALEMITTYEQYVRGFTEANRGMVINFYGDGSLCTFEEVGHAIQAATDIQGAFREHAHIPLRIGIHRGEAIFQNNNVYGDAVNIASRIESMGQSGAVLISEIAYGELTDNSVYTAELLGTYEFKNVKSPMHIYAMTHGGLRVPDRSTIQGKFKDKHDPDANKSIVVLPFQNASDDPAQQIFVDGISDEIRSQLLTVEGLKVIARSSSMSYNEPNPDLSQIGRELHVSYVLEGRVHIQGNRVRLNIELSQTTTNKQVWSMPPLEISLEDLPVAQNDIALSVANELRVMLSDEEKDQLARVSTTNKEAFLEYQKGIDLLHRGHGKVEELSDALLCFQKAIDLDPKFSKAYIGLADAYFEHMFWGRAPAKDVLAKAKEAAEAALQLDDTSGEVYGVLGAINYFTGGPVEESVNNLEKAISLSPSYLGAYEKMAWIQIFKQNPDESLRLFKIAQELDPLSTKYIGDVGHAYYYNNQIEEGIQYIEKYRAKYPNDPWLLWMHAYLLSGKGDYQGALDLLTQRSTSGKKSNWMIGYNYGKLGRTDEAMAIINYHVQKSMFDFVPAYMIAVMYIGVGDKENALLWLEKDKEQGGQGLFFKGLKLDPKFAELKGEPRFEELFL